MIQLTRRDDWRNQIVYAISSADEIEWENDNQRIGYAFFIIERITMVDLLEKIAKHYGKEVNELTEKQIIKYLNKKLEKTNPLQCRQGDLIYHEEHGFGICVGFLNTYARKDRGVDYVDRKIAQDAWKIG